MQSIFFFFDFLPECAQSATIKCAGHPSNLKRKKKSKSVSILNFVLKFLLHFGGHNNQFIYILASFLPRSGQTNKTRWRSRLHHQPTQSRNHKPTVITGLQTQLHPAMYLQLYIRGCIFNYIKGCTSSYIQDIPSVASNAAPQSKFNTSAHNKDINKTLHLRLHLHLNLKFWQILVLS